MKSGEVPPPILLNGAAWKRVKTRRIVLEQHLIPMVTTPQMNLSVIKLKVSMFVLNSIQEINRGRQAKLIAIVVESCSLT